MAHQQYMAQQAHQQYNMQLNHGIPGMNDHEQQDPDPGNDNGDNMGLEAEDSSDRDSKRLKLDPFDATSNIEPIDETAEVSEDV